MIQEAMLCLSKHTPHYTKYWLNLWTKLRNGWINQDDTQVTAFLVKKACWASKCKKKFCHLIISVGWDCVMRNNIWGSIFAVFTVIRAFLCHPQWSALAEGPPSWGTSQDTPSILLPAFRTSKVMLLCQDLHHSVKVHCIISLFELLCHSAGEYRGGRGISVLRQEPILQVTISPWPKLTKPGMSGMSGRLSIGVVSSTFNENPWILWTELGGGNVIIMNCKHLFNWQWQLSFNYL